VASGARITSLDILGIVRLMATQVRLTLVKAIAKANLRRAEAGVKPITMNLLATQAGVTTTTITRLARDPADSKSASALSLDLASKVVTVLDCGIDDLLKISEVGG
jgi:DNA-binding Xre family transcriptional regulator